MLSSDASSSNWDFTPVINLLRSPAYGGGHSSNPSRHAELPAVSPSPEEALKSGSHNWDDDLRSSSPKLGDFSSLWDFLGRNSVIESKDVTVEESHPEGDATPTQTSFPPSAPIRILKRASNQVTSPECVTQPIPISTTSKSQILQDKAEFDIKSFDAGSSESTAGIESDDVFRTPLTKRRGVLSMIPPQVGIPVTAHQAFDTPPSSFDELDESLIPETIKNPPRNGPNRVYPIAYRSAAERRVGLLTKLLKNFPEYAETVAQAGRPVKRKTKNISSRPIHVFVDMSNIMVGFHDLVKISRNIPVQTRIRRLPLSFQNFSLVLERGRPTAKRVLVGSDRFPAINEGEGLGYEANILDRVQKVKHLTRHQRKFRKTGRGDSQEFSSSETNDVPGERWVEQGVDEILHLKLLESLLDADEPATIVLATGDAAEAEYSGGFMKMVERALQRGWNVELVSFAQVTSYAYRKKEFRTKWGSHFKMIILDEYIEELLDM